jgi:trans-aconitate methyltransferase
LTRQLAEWVAHGKVLGIDSSLGMLRQAQKTILPNLAFRRLDINEILTCLISCFKLTGSCINPID